MQFKQLRIEPWKSQDFNGVWTRDLTIPVRRSNQLSYEATDVGSWSCVSSNEPVKNGCEVIYEMFNDIWNVYRPIRLTQCCTQFKSLGVKVLCVFYLQDNEAFTFKWYGNTWNKNVLFPKDLNWVQHWVSRIGLCNVGIDVPQPNWHKAWELKWGCRPRWPVYIVE